MYCLSKSITKSVPETKNDVEEWTGKSRKADEKEKKLTKTSPTVKINRQACVEGRGFFKKSVSSLIRLQIPHRILLHALIAARWDRCWFEWLWALNELILVKCHRALLICRRALVECHRTLLICRRTFIVGLGLW
jgi:hypothetical protein